MPTSEDLVHELVVLVRGLRELGASAPWTTGPRLDLPAAVVLAHLRDEGPLRLSGLADRLCLDASTVSRQVPALERAGWLVREADPDDRRAQLLRLTDEGRSTLDERRRRHAVLLRGALPDWSDAELQDLTATLSRLNADLSARPATADHRKVS